MNIAIVDDLPNDQVHLQELLNTYASLHHLSMEIRCFSSAEELLSVYQPLRFTILFLDIYLDGMTGTQAAEKIRRIDEDVPIVYLTTSDEHRAEAFDTFAAAYLVKPAGEASVFRILDHILRRRTQVEQDHFCFVSDRREQSLPYSRILSLHSDKNYVILTELDGSVHKIRMLFSEAEELCRRDRRFLTITRGVIVNLDHVLSVTRDICRLKQDIRYPLNTRKSHLIQQMWYNYNFEKLRSGGPASDLSPGETDGHGGHHA